MHAFAGLYEQCLLRSTERTESHALIAEELSDHRLRWHGAAVDTRLYKFQAQQLALYSLQYGDAVSIFPKLYENFSLVHFSLSGAIEIECDGQRQTVYPQRAVITTPRKGIHLHWSRMCEQLILRVPHEALRDAAAALGQPELFRTFLRTPGLMFSTARSHHWHNQLQAFMSVQHQAGLRPVFQPWLQHLELGMAMFLLLQLPDARSTHGVDTFGWRPPKDLDTRTASQQRRLNRLCDYIDQHLSQPVTLADMARACALSERQLNTLCHAELGAAPKAWLRQQRLEAARQALLQQPDAEVSAIALMYGFTHLGRFAATYRAQFGELPSQTLKSAKSG